MGRGIVSGASGQSESTHWVRARSSYYAPWGMKASQLTLSMPRETQVKLWESRGAWSKKYCSGLVAQGGCVPSGVRWPEVAICDGRKASVSLHAVL